MPWVTPTLKALRLLNKNAIQSKTGAPIIPSSMTRYLADTNAGNAHLALRYVDWLADQLLPDRAEHEWLDRHGNIWLLNADSSRGRKLATLATGTATATTTSGTVVVPDATPVQGAGLAGLGYETVGATTVGVAPTNVSIRAVQAGKAGNADPGDILSFGIAMVGVNSNLTVVELTGGADDESDDDLLVRILKRIREPPMGGDATDYEAWALAVPGVTRAWAAPNEMGMGTVTIRFMCDELRATGDPMTDGFPLPADITAVTNYIDTVRPVTLKDRFIQAPIPYPINLTISHLDPDTMAMHNAIQASIATMLKEVAKPAHSINGALQPAQTIFAAWVSEAILSTPGVFSFDLTMADAVMPNGGNMAVLGSITWA